MCFISQNESNRYYSFLDLTSTNILTCTEEDISGVYSGISNEEFANFYYEGIKQILENYKN